MSSGEWWNDTSSSNAVGDYDPTQTGTTTSGLDPNTVYSPPGDQAPIDQYNYTPNPQAAGGYDTYAPGQIAPLNAAQFSNTSGQYPNDQDMSQSIANQYAQDATITADGSANLGGFGQLPQQEQQSWRDYYGDAMAQYAWGQQTGNYNVPAAAQGFQNLPLSEQNTWYGTYGDQAPAVWAQQAAQNMMGGGGATGSPQPDTWAQYQNLIYNPQNNWFDPATGRHTGWGSIGAGTQWTSPGWGVPAFGQAPIQIDPSNWAVLNNPELQQKLAPGYIPGSGTYNQYRLDQGGLFGNIAGQMSNLRYGLGGTGDPTTGLEQQTPQEWVQGGKLFNSTRTSNWGQGDQQGTGLDYIATMFLRPDTPSGINTAAWSAPQQYWTGMGQQIANGQIQPTNRGWAAMVAHGITPEKLGAQAVAQAKSVGVAPNGQGSSVGGTGGAGQGPMGPGSEAFNYQQSYLAYLTARMNQFEIPGMNQLNDREKDKLAFEKAKQEWLQQYQQQTFGEGQRQFNELQGLRQGELVGSYNGQQTLASRAEQNQTALGYLNLLGQLRGPGDIFQYLKVLNGTPGGIRDIVNAASGAYRMPTTGGGNITVGGGANTGGAADLNSLLGQINNPNYGAEAQNLNLPLPNQINALALQRMTPSQQQSLLAAYEAAGYNPQDVLSIFKNSMPQYQNQGGGAGRVNLWR